MSDPSEYIELIMEYRNQRGLPTPTQDEIQDLTDQWSRLKNKDRQREIDNVKARLVILRLDLTRK